MFNLQALALHFEKGFIVGDLGDDRGNLLAKLSFELFRRSVSVLDGVVQECGGEDRRIGDAGFVGQYIFDRNRVVDVGAGVSAFNCWSRCCGRRKRSRLGQLKLDYLSCVLGLVRPFVPSG